MMSFRKKDGIFCFRSTTDIHLEDLDIETLNRMAEEHFNP